MRLRETIMRSPRLAWSKNQADHMAPIPNTARTRPARVESVLIFCLNAPGRAAFIGAGQDQTSAKKRLAERKIRRVAGLRGRKTAEKVKKGFPDGDKPDIYAGKQRHRLKMGRALIRRPSLRGCHAFK